MSLHKGAKYIVIDSKSNILQKISLWLEYIKKREGILYIIIHHASYEIVYLYLFFLCRRCTSSVGWIYNSIKKILFIALKKVSHFYVIKICLKLLWTIVGISIQNSLKKVYFFVSAIYGCPQRQIHFLFLNTVQFFPLHKTTLAFLSHRL